MFKYTILSSIWCSLFFPPTLVSSESSHFRTLCSLPLSLHLFSLSSLRSAFCLCRYLDGSFAVRSPLKYVFAFLIYALLIWLNFCFLLARLFFLHPLCLSFLTTDLPSVLPPFCLRKALMKCRVFCCNGHLFYNSCNVIWAETSLQSIAPYGMIITMT